MKFFWTAASDQRLHVLAFDDFERSAYFCIFYISSCLRCVRGVSTMASSGFKHPYDMKVKKKDSERVMKLCWEWKWDVMRNVLEFEEKDRFWYSSKSSKSKNAGESWIIVCDEETYDKFVIWGAKRRSKQRKTRVDVEHETEEIMKEE